MLARLADRLVLAPSRHEIDPGSKTRLTIPFRQGKLEAWTQVTGSGRANDEPELFILKFDGNASRAEWASGQPAELWPDISSEVWSINKPGYGGSTGPASLRTLAAAAETAFEAISSKAGSRPLLVTGNSLGTAQALHLAASRPVAGLLLRNPVPLRRLILRRYGWWNLFLGSALIASQIPAELDAAAKAQQCNVPALIVQSGADTLVPREYQAHVIDAYCGEKQVWIMEGAEHNSLMTPEQLSAYRDQLQWLRSTIGLGPSNT